MADDREASIGTGDSVEGNMHWKVKGFVGGLGGLALAILFLMARDFMLEHTGNAALGGYLTAGGFIVLGAILGSVVPETVTLKVFVYGLLAPSVLSNLIANTGDGSGRLPINLPPLPSISMQEKSASFDLSRSASQHILSVDFESQKYKDFKHSVPIRQLKEYVKVGAEDTVWGGIKSFVKGATPYDGFSAIVLGTSDDLEVAEKFAGVVKMQFAPYSSGNDFWQSTLKTQIVNDKHGNHIVVLGNPVPTQWANQIKQKISASDAIPNLIRTNIWQAQVISLKNLGLGKYTSMQEWRTKNWQKFQPEK